MNDPPVPRVFNLFGTIIYAGCSITAFGIMIAMPWWMPPWWILLPTFGYVFTCTGIIAMGRVQSNRDAKAFAHLLRVQSEINKRSMNLCGLDADSYSSLVPRPTYRESGANATLPGATGFGAVSMKGR